jgi:hypothetical protein
MDPMQYIWDIWDTLDARRPSDDTQDVRRPSDDNPERIGDFALRQMDRRLRQLRHMIVEQYSTEFSRITNKKLDIFQEIRKLKKSYSDEDIRNLNKYYRASDTYIRELMK